MPKNQSLPASAGDKQIDRDVLRSIRKIIQAVDIYSRRLASQHGLTGPQVVCLREIQREGPMNPGTLARAVSLTPPTVSGILDRLEVRGLLTRQRRNRDKRQVLVQLTPEGEELLARTPPPLQELFTQRFRELPSRRQKEIAAALRDVVALMAAEDIEAAPLLAPGAANPAVLELPYQTTDKDEGRHREAG